MSQELKPCPFCGRPASVRGDFGLEQIACSDPTGQCPGADVNLPAYNAIRRADSIAAWNRRHEAQQAAADARDAGVDAFLADVRAEIIRARAKFPGDRIMTVALAEEFGELVKAVLDESAANVRKEAVQTATMCARVVLDGDGSVNEWRAEKGLDALATHQQGGK